MAFCLQFQKPTNAKPETVTCHAKKEKMKYLNIIFFVFLSITYTFGQTDYINDYYSHKFPCDSGSTTLEINICSGIKRDYSDSLLNVVYNKIIKSLNKDIIDNELQLKTEQLKKHTVKEDKEKIEFLIKEISYNKRLKESIIKSQRKWIELRDLNMAVISITYEGGKAFVSIENQSLIDDTLTRIKKLLSFYEIDD